MALELTEFEEAALTWGIAQTCSMLAAHNKELNRQRLSLIDPEQYKNALRNEILARPDAKKMVTEIASSYMDYLAQQHAMGSKAGRTRSSN